MDGHTPSFLDRNVHQQGRGVQVLRTHDPSWIEPSFGSTQEPPKLGSIQLGSCVRSTCTPRPCWWTFRSRKLGVD
jgi:hypothetical protein